MGNLRASLEFTVLYFGGLIVRIKNGDQDLFYIVPLWLEKVYSCEGVIPGRS